MDFRKVWKDIAENREDPVLVLGVLLVGLPVLNSRLNWFYRRVNGAVGKFGERTVLVTLVIAVIGIYVLFLSLHSKVKSIEDEVV